MDNQDKWVTHYGSEMPVPKDTLIRVRYRNGVEYEGLAGSVGSFRWSHQNKPRDIVAYCMLSGKLYGYLSKNGEMYHSYVFWKTPTGNTVKVTGVGSTKIPANSGYLWSDAALVGEVTEYSHGGMKP